MIASSVDIDSPQKYTPGTNYIDKHDKACKTSGDYKMIYPECVVYNGQKLDLEITTETKSNPSTKTEITNGKVGIPIAKDTARKCATLKVLNSSGQAVDWTGIIGLGDLDYKDNTKETILIDPNYVKAPIHIGSNMKAVGKGTSSPCVGFNRYRAKDGTMSDNTWNSNAMNVTNAYYLEAHIPTSGLKIYCTHEGGSTSGGCVTIDAGVAKSYFGSTTGLNNAIKTGGWNPY